jgi:hypothetical protein
MNHVVLSEHYISMLRNEIKALPVVFNFIAQLSHIKSDLILVFAMIRAHKIPGDERFQLLFNPVFFIVRYHDCAMIHNYTSFCARKAKK